MWWGSCPGGGGEDARALFSLRLGSSSFCLAGRSSGPTPWQSLPSAFPHITSLGLWVPLLFSSCSS